MAKQTQIIIRSPMVDRVFTWWPGTDEVSFHMSNPERWGGRLLDLRRMSAVEAASVIRSYLSKL